VPPEHVLGTARSVRERYERANRALVALMKKKKYLQGDGLTASPR
jgi:hypothetical protein